MIGYQYDDLGRLTRLTYPDGRLVGYAYDAAGRLSTVTDWASRVTTYAYDAVGRVTQVLRPNGTRQTRAYDAAGQLTQLTELASDGVTVIYSGTHSYDAAGQLMGETLLPGVAPAAVNLTQTFDRDNRLLTHQGAAATFDADGNLLSIAAGVAPASYTYDARNRLTSAGSLSYGYNAEDRRTAVTDASGTTRYTVNPNAVLDQVLVRTTPDGTKTFYIYGLGLLHEETGSAVRYYHHDRRGDTVALTDGAGAVTDRASYGVYGELLSRTGATNTPFLFNGQWGVQTDGNGLYCHRARYYHPQLRRFLNQDIVLASITVHVGLNQFAYANGNPVSLIDPFGLAGRSTAEFIRNLGQIISTTPITGSGVVGDTITSLGNNLLIQDGNVFNAANATLNPAYAAMTRFAEASSGLGLQCDDLGESLSTRQRIISGALGVVDTASTVFTATGAVPLGRRFVASAAESAGSNFVLQGLTKAEARAAAQGMGLPNAQAAAVNSALSRATTSSTIKVTQYGSDVVVQVMRPGQNGFQVIETVVNQNGTKTVLQKAYDAAGELVHYHPKGGG